MQKYLFIAAGGALGAIARFWVGNAVVNRFGARFPWGTFVINITACIIIGFSLTFLARRTAINPAWRYMIPVGFVGAYSTFSTYEWETFSAVRAGGFSVAAIYAFTSLLLGIVAVWCGVFLAEVIS